MKSIFKLLIALALIGAIFIPGPAAAGFFGNNASDLVKKGREAYRSGNKDRAEALLKKARETEFTVAGASYLLGKIAYERGEYPAAARYFDAEWRYHKDSDAPVWEAACFLKLGDKKTALKTLDENADKIPLQRIAAEPELAELRELPEFKELVEKIRRSQMSPLEKIETSVTYIKETLGQIEKVALGVYRVFIFISSIVEKMGFKVAVVLLAIFVVAAGLNISGLAGGITGLIISMFTVFGFYYYFTLVFSPDHSADLVTIGKSFAWMAAPAAGLYLIAALVGAASSASWRALLRSRPVRAVAGRFLPPAGSDKKQMRRRLAEFDLLAEEYINETMEFLSADDDSARRRKALLNRDIARDKLRRLLDDETAPQPAPAPAPKNESAENIVDGDG